MKYTITNAIPQLKDNNLEICFFVTLLELQNGEKFDESTLKNMARQLFLKEKNDFENKYHFRHQNNGLVKYRFTYQNEVKVVVLQSLNNGIVTYVKGDEELL